jgi:hypothetical protein
VFADAIQVDSVIVTAVAVGIVLGIFRGVEWVVSRYRTTSKPEALLHWMDITGDQRPVTSAECKQRHIELQQELSRGSQKFNGQSERISGLSEAIAEIRGDIKAGFAAIPSQVAEVVDGKIDRHERTMHGSRRTGQYPRPSSRTGD